MLASWNSSDLYHYITNYPCGTQKYTTLKATEMNFERQFGIYMAFVRRVELTNFGFKLRYRMRTFRAAIVTIRHCIAFEVFAVLFVLFGRHRRTTYYKHFE
jgi:hypothetical protein